MPNDVSFQMPTTILSPDEVDTALRQSVAEAGTAKAFADQAGLSAQYVGDVLAGRRAAGDRILAALGLRRITVVCAQEDVR